MQVALTRLEPRYEEIVLMELMNARLLNFYLMRMISAGVGCPSNAG